MATVFGIYLLFKKRWRDLVALVVAYVVVSGFASLFMLTSSGQRPFAKISAPASAPLLRKQSADYYALESAEELRGDAPPVESYAQKSLVQVEPNATVQTGPGLPTWNWTSHELRWDGPVESSAKLKLCLLSPTIQFFLSAIRIILIVWLLKKMVRPAIDPKRLTAFAMLIIPFFGLPTEPAFAEPFPPKELLGELENRLLAEVCKQDCNLTRTLVLEVSDFTMQVTAEVDSDGVSGWPIPGPTEQFLPTSVYLDGRATTALRRDANGIVWVRIPNGSHRVTIRGTLPRNASNILRFSEIPKSVSFKSPDWTISGVSATGSVGSSVQLVRSASAPAVQQKRSGSDKVATSATENWFIVSREFQLGLPWRISTTVTRLGSLQQSDRITLALLSGETVTTRGIERTPEGKNIVADFAAGSRQVRFESTLEVSSVITLDALSSRNNVSYAWSISCSAIWSCAFEGSQPITRVAGGIQQLIYSARTRVFPT